jgi:release factor glutamine methyltransferase
MRSLRRDLRGQQIFQSFMGTDIEVGPGVLVPRAETELLGRTALNLIAALEAPTVIDMCCGSGNVGLGMFTRRPDIRLYGADLTPEAIGWARRNAARIDPTGRVIYEQGDMFEPLAPHGLEGRVDLIACNPPYISTHKLETESAFLLEEEPREAFDAGPYGIAIHQRLIADAPRFLVPGGWLVFEFGAGQDRQMRALLTRSRAYSQPTFFSDADGMLRVVAVQKP